MTSYEIGCATVVQFGLGHQIANLVTRVQIPAVALTLFIASLMSMLLAFQLDCQTILRPALGVS